MAKQVRDEADKYSEDVEADLENKVVLAYRKKVVTQEEAVDILRTDPGSFSKLLRK